MYSELFPIVATADLPRALRFYRDALGGSVTHEYPGDGAAPVYVGIDIGSSHMGVGLVADAEPGGRRLVSLWIYADDCDAAIERLRSQGVDITEEPEDQPWGERVARVRDPDGNEVIIGQRPAREQASESLGARLISPEPARYTRPEYERRFLVSPESAWRDLVEPPSKVFEDLYIRHTHLRLRTLSDRATGQEFIKLTKKLTSFSQVLTVAILGLAVGSTIYIFEKIEKPRKEKVQAIQSAPRPDPIDPGIGEFDAAMADTSWTGNDDNGRKIEANYVSNRDSISGSLGALGEVLERTSDATLLNLNATSTTQSDILDGIDREIDSYDIGGPDDGGARSLRRRATGGCPCGGSGRGPGSTRAPRPGSSTATGGPHAIARAHP